MSKKTGPLQLVSHNFINSQHSLNIFGKRYLIQFSIDHDKKFVNWLWTSCVFSNNSSDLTHLNSGILGWFRTTYHRHGNKKTSSKTIVGLCQCRKTAFEHVWQLLIPQNILFTRASDMFLINWWWWLMMILSDRITVCLKIYRFCSKACSINCGMTRS